MSKIEALKTSLINIVDNIDCNNSNISDEQCDELLDIVNKATNTMTKFSKYQACRYLNISRATFDNWVREGKIPKGKKEQGFKELFWTKKDLDKINQYTDK